MNETNGPADEEEVLSKPTLSVVTPEESASVIIAPVLERPERPQYELARSVFFVGFMVAGKTSTARRLARTCGVASVDMDTYLERREGKRVRELFAESGDDGFRDMESDVSARAGRQGAAARLVRRRRGAAAGEPRQFGAGGVSRVPAGDGRRGVRPRISDVSRVPIPRPGHGAQQRSRSACRCTKRWPTPWWTRPARAWRPSPARCAASWRGRASCAGNEGSRQHSRRGGLRRAHRRGRARSRWVRILRACPGARAGGARAGRHGRERGAALPRRGEGVACRRRASA